MSGTTAWRHWRLEPLPGGCQRLWLDVAGSRVNLLSREVLTEFGDVLDALQARPPAGLVLQSAKEAGFISGADINEFIKIEIEHEAIYMIEFGQHLLDRLESLPCPSVAVIHGYCLGGGLELALACRYRVAREGEDVRLGLPEVRLGIHPGFGGTLRLTRLLGPPRALELMLSGRQLTARQALALGLLDAVVPARHLETAALDMLKRQPPARRSPVMARLLSFWLPRQILALWMKRGLRARARPEHYPAPYSLLELWCRHGADGERDWLAAEARSVAGLLITPTSRQLTRVFFLNEKLKNISKQYDFKDNNVHVIGSGVMGGDIAAWAALRGFTVSLQDQDMGRIAAAVERAARLFRERLRQPRLVQAAMDRLIPDPGGQGLPHAGVIIEAIFEDLTAKQVLFRQVEARVRPDALLASNTSSLPLEGMAEVLQRPERLIGLHFFNPVPRMPLVEVVRGANTSPESLQRGLALVGRLDKLPLEVRSAPGFLVNRVLMPYLLAAASLHAEGTPAARVDAAARIWGMPMGPLELADTVGLDICLHVARQLAPLLGVAVPPALEARVAAGELGRKAGRGFYSWAAGKPLRGSARGMTAAEAAALQERMLTPLRREARRCLEEGIVADADAVDAGLIFGAGYPPFRGGPLTG